MSWRTRLELALGRTQLAVIERSLATVAGLTRRTIAVPGVGDVAVLERPGHDPPVVAVHGFGGDKETWLLIAPLLARGRRLVLIDLPAHGRSSDVATPATPRLYADAVRGVLDDAGVARAVVLGNSLGGGVGLRLAHDHPERVSALILIASAGPWAHEPDKTRSWVEGANPLIPDASDAGAQELLSRVLEKPPAVPRAVLRYVAARRAAQAERLRTLFRDFVRARDGEAIPADLAAIRAPTLLVHGERDRVIDVDSSHQLARRLPAAALHVLPGIGHVPQLETPSRVARLIERFVAARVR